ncbi:hypothetical protein Tco_0111029 [Tanacetum coccineum]
MRFLANTMETSSSKTTPTKKIKMKEDGKRSTDGQGSIHGRIVDAYLAKKKTVDGKNFGFARFTNVVNPHSFETTLNSIAIGIYRLKDCRPKHGMRLRSPESLENGVKSSFQRNAITATTNWLRGKCVSAQKIWSSFSTICLSSWMTPIYALVLEIQGEYDEVFSTDSLDSKSTEDASSNHDDGADNDATDENDELYDDESNSNNLFLGEVM